MYFNLNYIVIVFCFFLCLIKNMRNLKEPDTLILLSALSFTLLADYFLIFTLRHFIGIAFFCLVQFCYCRILHHSLIPMIENGLLGCFFLWMAGIIFTLPLDTISLIAAFYFTCLLTNIVFAWRSGNKWFAAAITLMLLCDINVAVSNISSYFRIPLHTPLSVWHNLAPTAVWIFYVPSQFIIACQKSHDPSFDYLK